MKRFAFAAIFVLFLAFAGHGLWLLSPEEHRTGDGLTSMVWFFTGWWVLFQISWTCIITLNYRKWRSQMMSAQDLGLEKVHTWAGFHAWICAAAGILVFGGFPGLIEGPPAMFLGAVVLLLAAMWMARLLDRESWIIPISTFVAGVAGISTLPNRFGTFATVFGILILIPLLQESRNYIPRRFRQSTVR